MTLLSIGQMSQDTNIRKDVLDKTLKAQKTKEKIHRWDSTQFRSFCTAEETINRVNGHPSEWK